MKFTEFLTYITIIRSDDLNCEISTLYGSKDTLTKVEKDPSASYKLKQMVLTSNNNQAEIIFSEKFSKTKPISLRMVNANIFFLDFLSTKKHSLFIENAKISDILTYVVSK